MFGIIAGIILIVLGYKAYKKLSALKENSEAVEDLNQAVVNKETAKIQVQINRINGEVVNINTSELKNANKNLNKENL